MKLNPKKTREVHADGNKLALAKNKGYKPSFLGGRSIDCSEWVSKIKTLGVYEIFNVQQLQFYKACKSCLRGFMVLIASYQ